MDITSTTLSNMFTHIADAMAREKDRLCQLDGVIGDADHGIAMDLGFSAAAKAAQALTGLAQQALLETHHQPGRRAERRAVIAYFDDPKHLTGTVQGNFVFIKGKVSGYKPAANMLALHGCKVVAGPR